MNIGATMFIPLSAPSSSKRSAPSSSKRLLESLPRMIPQTTTTEMSQAEKGIAFMQKLIEDSKNIEKNDIKTIALIRNVIQKSIRGYHPSAKSCELIS
eukprot:TRINITY_DN1887_c0_g1_i1.p1 TRINITY_DN1887_c0_g1~~TRINITY_DN1887_c0_g1_i1.p1  ORF type:complete len:98 (+),score=6.34 TRINITY_DN1887_c0_g1_i1:31-324(+)